jgi:hypothetical protein
MLEMTESMSDAISYSLDSQTKRCDELLESEDVDDVKNACSILREWSTESGDVLPTMYLTEKLEDCKDEQLWMNFIDGMNIAYGGWYFCTDVTDD